MKPNVHPEVLEWRKAAAKGDKAARDQLRRLRNRRKKAWQKANPAKVWRDRWLRKLRRRP
jgi:hypothetical protein